MSRKFSTPEQVASRAKLSDHVAVDGAVEAIEAELVRYYDHERGSFTAGVRIPHELSLRALAEVDEGYKDAGWIVEEMIPKSTDCPRTNEKGYHYLQIKMKKGERP